MRRILLLFFTSMVMYGCSMSTESDQPVSELAERLLPDNNSSSFVFEKLSSDSDFFELEQAADDRIIIRGNNGVSIARGLNHYLRNYCH